MKIPFIFSVLRWGGGAEGNRTPDLYNAIVALSQLSYGPLHLGSIKQPRGAAA